MLYQDSAAKCCNACRSPAAGSSCAFYLWYISGQSGAFKKAGGCYHCSSADKLPDGANTLNQSIGILGKCNPSLSDDPHFIGAHGVQYDFNGLLDKSFCLVTDKRVHINALMEGYAPTGSKGGNKLHTWMR